MIDAIPPLNILRDLFAAFSSHFFICELVHQPAFAREIEQFSILYLSGQVSLVDPAWLSLMLAALAVGAKIQQFRGVQEIPGYGSSAEAGFRLHQSAMMALEFAQWRSRPQVRCAQAILMFGAYWVAFPTGESALANATEWTIWLSAAIRICQLLGLQQIEEASCNGIPDDPAWPSGNNPVKLERAKRLWHWCWAFDTLDRMRPTLPYQMRLGDFKTPVPNNLFDTDLEGTCVQREDTIITEASYTRVSPVPQTLLVPLVAHRFCHRSTQYRSMLSSLQHRQLRKLRQAPISYSIILDIDADIRQTFKSYLDPSFGKHNSLSRLSKHAPFFKASINNRVSTSRCLRSELTNKRATYQLLRLHRPFMLAAHQNFASTSAADSKLQGARISRTGI